MNTEELRAALQDAGVYPGYSIRGQPPPGWLDEGAVYLDRDDDGRWVFGTHERGRHQPLQYFDDEDAACRFVLNYLTEPRRPPRIRTPEEVAADEAHMRRRMQELRAEIERRKREHRESQ